MFCHAYHSAKFKKQFFWVFIALITHAYFVTVLLLMNELATLVSKTKTKPFYGNGYRRKYDTKGFKRLQEI